MSTLYHTSFTAELFGILAQSSEFLLQQLTIVRSRSHSVGQEAGIAAGHPGADCTACMQLSIETFCCFCIYYSVGCCVHSAAHRSCDGSCTPPACTLSISMMCGFIFPGCREEETGGRAKGRGPARSAADRACKTMCL